MRRDKKQEVALRVGIALAAGMFSIIPVAHGAPVGGTVVTGGADISYSNAANGGIDTSITSTNKNNVIDWHDFSVAQGETVLFDNGAKTNNYMNIVTGANTSEINGALKGGNEVYIINPNGVIIGENASVDVGSIYASTRYVSTTDAAAAANTAGATSMASVLANTSAGVATDVVNMGTINATDVVVEGQNIRFYSDNVTATNRVTLKAGDGGYIHVGNGTGSNAGYSSATLVTGSSPASVEYFQTLGTDWGTVKSTINNAPGENYMLTGNIDASGSAGAITANFTGKLDGNGYKISHITSAPGLFTQTDGAKVYNVGVADSTIVSSGYAGAIVANATNSTLLKNVYNENSAVDGKNASNSGGLVGQANGVTITESYNTGTIYGGKGSGILARSVSGTNTITDSYTTGSVDPAVYYGYDTASTLSFNRVYATSASRVGVAVNTNITGTNTIINKGNNYIWHNSSGVESNSTSTGITPNLTALDTYLSSTSNIGQGWGADISSTGGVSINTTTGAVTRPIWRIYEGQSTPLLTSQFKGIKNANYTYGYFDSNGTLDTSALVYNNGINGTSFTDMDGSATYVISGDDLPAYTGVTSSNTPNGLLYNGKTLKIVDNSDSSNITAATATNGLLDDASLAFSTKGISTIDTSHVYYDSAGRKDATATVTNSTAVTQNVLALLYSDQTGYDIKGGNVSIAPRAVTTGAALSNSTVVKEYDGTSDASSGVASIFAGNSTTVNGILPTDSASVTFTGTAEFVDGNGQSSKAVGLYENNTTNPGYVDINGTIALSNGGNNYYLSGSTSLSGQAKGAIAQKTLTVTLNNTSGINKTYDKNAIAIGTDSSGNIINGGSVQSTDFNFDTTGIVSTTTGGNTTTEDVDLDFDTTAYYVDSSGNQRSDATTHDVLFGGLKLTGNDAGNYKLVDGSGNVLYSANPLVEVTTDIYGNKTASISATPYTAGGELYGSGTIGKRNISSTGFVWYDGSGTAQAATREYDGSVTYTDPNGYTVSNATTTAAGTGMLAGDNLTFTVQSAKFVDSNTSTSGNATKNVNDATGVLYTVQITGTSAGNYTLDGNTINTNGTNLVVGTGSITPRTLNVSVLSTGYAQKTYDGNDEVKDASGNTQFGLGSYLDYTNANDTAHHLLNDGSSIVITGAYQITGSEGAAQNVNYDSTNNQVLNKNVTYTAEIYENGAASTSGNYVFSTSNATIANFNGTGIIDQAEITGVTFADVSKTYDGTADVTNTNTTVAPLLTDDVITITAATGLVNNETVSDVFNVSSSGAVPTGTTLITGEYGTFSGNNFTADENVSRDANNNVISKDVGYIGLENLLNNHNYKLSSTLGKTDNNGVTRYAGTGTINPFAINNAAWIVLDRNTTPITKVYDGSQSLTGTNAGGTAVTPDTYLTTRKAYVTPNGGTTTLNATVTVAGANYASQHSGNQVAQDVTYLIDVANTGNYTIDPTIKGTSGYVEKTLTGEGVITPKAITITSNDIVDSNITKTYDSTAYVGGNTAGIISGENLITFASQMISGDGNSNATTATYNTPGASTVSGDKTVTYDLTVTGTDPSDYYFVNSSGNTITTFDGAGTIDKRQLGVTFGTVSKVYDTTANVTNTGTDTITYTLSNDIASDNVTLTIGTGGVTGLYGTGTGTAFVRDENVATGKSVQYSNLNAALGTFADNYEFAIDEAYGTGSITKASITMSDFKFAIAGATREYNGGMDVADSAQNVTADQFVTQSYIDLGNNNTYSLNGIYTINSAEFNTANAGPGKTVTYKIGLPTTLNLTNFTITGYDANHFVTNPVTATDGVITPKTVYAIINNPTVTKTYNADNDVLLSSGTAATANDLVTIAGLVGNSTNQSSAIYTDINHGTNKDVAYTIAVSDPSNYNIYYDPTDTNAANYTMGYASAGSTIINTVTTPNNVINTKNLELTFGPVTKVYDGTTTVPSTVTVTPTFNGLEGSDSVTLSSYTAAYNSPDVLTATTVTYDDIVVADTAGGNNAYANGNYVLVDGSGTALVTGTNTGNITTGVGTITKYTLTSAPTFSIGTVTKEYDTTDAVAVNRDTTLSKVAAAYLTASPITVNGISQPLPFTLTAANYDNAAKGIGKTATFTVALNSNNINFNNFTTNGIYTVSTNTAEITARKVYLSLDTLPTITKVYDGTTNVAQDVTNQIIVRSGDLLGDDAALDNSATTINAHYLDSDVATGKDVYYQVKLKGTDSGNYELHDLANWGTANDNVITQLIGTGDITPATLTISIAPKDKPYNGSAAIEGLTATDITITGVNNETVTVGTAVLGDITGVYSDANVSWNGNTVADKGITYTFSSTFFADLLAGDNTVRNYSAVANLMGGNTLSYTAADAKGQINPVTITSTPEAHWTAITREYDHTRDVYGQTTGSTPATVTNPTDILYFTVKDSNNNIVTDSSGKALKLDYTVSNAQFDNKDHGTTHVLDYTIGTVTSKISDGQGYANYVLDTSVVTGLAGSTVSSNADNIITARVLDGTLTSATGQRKIYDGNDSADVSNFLINSDDWTVLGLDNLQNAVNVSATYNNVNATVNPDAPDTNALTVTYNLTLNDTSGNYTVGILPTATGDIERRKVYVTGTNVTGIDKVYDGTTAMPNSFSPAGRFSFTPTDTVNKTGIVAGEEDIDLETSDVTGIYSSAYVNRNADGTVGTRSITFTGFSLVDKDSSNTDSVNNYILAGDVTGSGTISPKNLRVSIVSGPTKVYDRTTALTGTYATDANINLNAADLVTGDSASVTVNSGTYKTAKADTGKEYSYDIKLNNSNYSLVQGDTNQGFAGGTNGLTTTLTGYNGTITPYSISAMVKDATGQSKIYDGNTLADVGNFVIDATDMAFLTADGAVGEMTVTANYDDKNANTTADAPKNGKTVNYTLSTTNTNYTIATPTATAKGDIYRREVYLQGAGLTDIDKTYDGSDAVADSFNKSGHFSLVPRDEAAKTGIVAGEEDIVLSLANVTGQYADAHVKRGTDGSVGDKDIIFRGFSLWDTNSANDDSVNNYIVVGTVAGNGAITPRPLTATVNNAPTKEYDGNTAVTDTYKANNNIIVSGLLNGDSANILIDDAYYMNPNAGTANKDYVYELTLGNADYSLTSGTVKDNGLTTTISGTNGTITPRSIFATVNGVMTKEYDGNVDGTENALANVSLSRVLSGENVGLTAVAKYDNPNAGISEDSDELQNHVVAYTLNLSNPNYQLADSTIYGTGTISRKGLTIVATPATINSGEAMPQFTGEVQGFVTGEENFASAFTFASNPTVTNSSIGSNPIYGWYRNQTAGNFGLNYTFTQDAANDTAFTVQASTPFESPDLKPTPNGNIYNQISHDMSSGFGDNGVAAIEYMDKSGNVIARENIDSGEIHGTGIESGINITGIDTDSTTLANIGIVGGDIVNLEGADAASTANIEVDGNGSIVNLEVFSIEGEQQKADSSSAAEIVSTDRNGNSDMEIRSTDSDGKAAASIQIVDESGNVLEENEEDKAEKKNKEGEIAIESSDNQDDDEIELKVENEGVNVA